MHEIIHRIKYRLCSRKVLTKHEDSPLAEITLTPCGFFPNRARGYDFIIMLETPLGLFWFSPEIP